MVVALTAIAVACHEYLIDKDVPEPFMITRSIH